MAVRKTRRRYASRRPMCKRAEYLYSGEYEWSPGDGGEYWYTVDMDGNGNELIAYVDDTGMEGAWDRYQWIVQYDDGTPYDSGSESDPDTAAQMAEDALIEALNDSYTARRRRAMRKRAAFTDMNGNVVGVGDVIRAGGEEFMVMGNAGDKSIFKSLDNGDEFCVTPFEMGEFVKVSRRRSAGKRRRFVANMVRKARRRRARRRTAAYGYFSDEAVDSVHQEFSDMFYSELGDFSEACDKLEEMGLLNDWQDRAFEYIDTELGHTLDAANNVIDQNIGTDAADAASDFISDITAEYEDAALTQVIEDVTENYLNMYESGEEVDVSDIQFDVDEAIYYLDDLNLDDSIIVNEIRENLEDNEIVVLAGRRGRR